MSHSGWRERASGGRNSLFKGPEAMLKQKIHCDWSLPRDRVQETRVKRRKPEETMGPCGRTASRGGRVL